MSGPPSLRPGRRSDAAALAARNDRARRFYGRAGLVLTATRDGSGNEEGKPDCTYRWWPG